jgi:DNA polymerase III epsilon subunit-like protein
MADQATADADAPNNAAAKDPAKVARRRHKKLRKKATTILPHPLSGILVKSDWEEFLAGHAVVHDARTEAEDANDKVSTALPGPTLAWRNPKYEQQQQVQQEEQQATKKPTAEGAHQRDILYHLLGQGRRSTPSNSTVPPLEGNKKRPRPDDKNDNEDAPSTSGGSTAKTALPAWVTVHNPVAASAVVLLEVHVASPALRQGLGVQLAQLAAPALSTTTTADQFQVLTVGTRWFTNQHPKSIAESFLYAAPPKLPKHKKKMTKGDEEEVLTLSKLEGSLYDFVLTSEQLAQEGYPTAALPTDVPVVTTSVDAIPPSSNLAPDEALALVQPFQVMIAEKEGCEETVTYVSSPALPKEKNGSEPPAATTTGGGRIYGLDCEMVETMGGRRELARFSLLLVTGYDATKQEATTTVVWDTLVLPEERVTNYLTEWSGVSAELLHQGPTVSLVQVQAFLLRQLHPLDILVGHSLENDLWACRYIHRTCVDTAVLFRPVGRKFKYSLRNLALQLLKRTIQLPDKPHCSEEDAQASLDLAVRRAVEGPSFGLSDTRSSNQWANLAKDRTTVALGPPVWLQKHITSQASAVHALNFQGVQDDSRQAVLAWMGPKRRAGLVWAFFELGEDEGDAFVEYMASVLKKASFENTVVGVALQSGYASTVQLHQHRRARQSGKTTLGWTDEEEKRFVTKATDCQNGSMLWFTASGQPK